MSTIHSICVFHYGNEEGDNIMTSTTHYVRRQVNIPVEYYKMETDLNEDMFCGLNDVWSK